ncbi:Subtilase family protein [bacterium A37T11]|nr:Subtilase family protein [bacterium A37T11]
MNRNLKAITVDVFALGVRNRSTAPKNTYVRLDGTSMAAPVVFGLAALIWSYYPKLTVPQLQEIILRSVIKSTKFVDHCVTGGVVNAYKAIKLGVHF